MWDTSGILISAILSENGLVCLSEVPYLSQFQHHQLALIRIFNLLSVHPINTLAKSTSFNIIQLYALSLAFDYRAAKGNVFKKVLIGR